MNKEQLKNHLNNSHLMTAIESFFNISESRRNLAIARKVLEQNKISTLHELNAKTEELSKIERGYNALFEEGFGLTWQNISIINKYKDTNIDELPNNLSW